MNAFCIWKIIRKRFKKITFEPENFSGAIKVTVGQNFGTTHGSNDAKYWNTTEKGFTEKGAYIVSDTTSSNQRVFSGFELEVSREIVCERLETEKFVGYTFDFPLEKAQQDSLTKYITNLAEKNISLAEAEFVQKGHSNLSKQHECGYEAAKASQQAFWENVWAKFDIKIDGDLKNQQGIRYCIFQLQQTYHGQDPTNNIGAKGLTGEAYNGHAFWDTETCCLPYYLFTNLKAAKNLLEFRYSTLAEAKNRARQLDCEGACYPIATLNGEEACTLWQHASTQFQPSTGVAYGIWHYVHLSEDNEFLYNHGAEMLTEIARFLRSRGDYSAATGKFGFYGVMGPDEFQVMVNHNSYTNYMAKMTFLYTIQVLKEMKSTAPEQYAALQAKTNVTEVEINEWKNAADQTLLLQEANGLFEQHDGYFDLPHINVDQIPVEDFPLYSHWSYDRIYRNDMIKQPDVLMFQFLYNQQFSKAEKRVNYEYYEPRTIHESSLSPSVHSVLASELGKHEEAFDFFGFATRMDLDNYNRNTREGLHTTSIAAAWVNIVYGFGGLRSDGPVLILNPTIPKKWNSYTFRVDYKQAIIEVHVEKTEAIFRVLNAETAAVMIYGKEETLDSTAKCIAIPAEWQN